MSSGGGEPAEGKEDQGAYVNNIGKVGGESKGARDVFLGIDAGGTDFWGRDVGNDPLSGLGPGEVPTHAYIYIKIIIVMEMKSS